MDTVLGFILRSSPSFIARWIVQYAPQTWLIRVCKRVAMQQYQQDQHTTIITAGILRISPGVAVLCGLGIPRRRATMQAYAHRRLNPSIVRVPRVYRFFENDATGHSVPDGYLFMEYVPGRTLEQLDTTATATNTGIRASKALTQRLARVVAHLQETKAESDTSPPGPVDSEMAQGYLWGDDGTKTVFGSVGDMNAWLNRRLDIIGKAIDLAPCYPLVLVHGDLCRRNIIVVDSDSDGDDDGEERDYAEKQLCLVDWDHSALLPRVFETTAMMCYNDDWGYAQGLLRATKTEIGGLTDVEEECGKLLMRARAGSLRYSF